MKSFIKIQRNKSSVNRTYYIKMTFAVFKCNYKVSGTLPEVHFKWSSFHDGGLEGDKLTRIEVRVVIVYKINVVRNIFILLFTIL